MTHTYTFRYFPHDGFLTHRVMRQCMTDDDARVWSHQPINADCGKIEIERDDGVLLKDPRAAA